MSSRFYIEEEAAEFTIVKRKTGSLVSFKHGDHDQSTHAPKGSRTAGGYKNGDYWPEGEPVPSNHMFNDDLPEHTYAMRTTEYKGVLIKYPEYVKVREGVVFETLDNNYNENLKVTKQAVAGAIDDLEARGDLDIKQINIDTVAMEGNGAIATTHTWSDTVNINSQLMATEEDVGFLVGADNPKTVVYHENAHALYGQDITTSRGSAENSKVPSGASISRYATFDEHEFISEAYTYQIVKGPLPPDAQKTWDNIMSYVKNV